jgi:hypothetical protein
MGLRWGNKRQEFQTSIGKESKMRLISAFFAMMISCASYAQTLVSGNNPNYTITNTKAQGDSTDYGYNNMVIARWITPQMLTVDKPTKVGVLAYHFSGIKRIEFFLNGGPATKITSRTWHDDILAYWVKIPAISDSDYNRLIAVVVPNNGSPFVLQGDPRYNPNRTPAGVDQFGNAFAGTTLIGVESLQFASDFGGSLRKITVFVDSVNGNDNNTGSSPTQARKTIFGGILAARDSKNNVDGATIKLLPGDYDFGTAYYIGAAYPRNFWRPVKIESHDPLNRARITGTNTNGRISLNSYHLKNLLIKPNVGASTLVTWNTAQYGVPAVTYIGDQPTTNEYLNAPKMTFMLVESCEVDNISELAPNSGVIRYNGSTEYKSRVEYVGCSINNSWFGYGSAHLVRKSDAYNIHSDMFRGGVCAVNFRYERFGKYVSSDAHPDMLQWYTPNGGNANTIVYDSKVKDGVVAETFAAQGIFSNPFGGGVVVNLALENIDHQGSYVRQLSLPSAHNVIIRNSNIGGSWTDGLQVIPNYDTGYNFLLQNVTRNKYSTFTGSITEIGSPVYTHHRTAWEAAGSPKRGIWNYQGTRYDFSYTEITPQNPTETENKSID